MGRNVWTTGRPTSSTAANTLDTEMTDYLKTQVTEIINHEHQCATSSGTVNGEHRPGACAVCYKGETDDIQGVSVVIDSDTENVAGGICYDTDKECMVLCTTGGDAATPYGRQPHRE